MPFALTAAVNVLEIICTSASIQQRKIVLVSFANDARLFLLLEHTPKKRELIMIIIYSAPMCELCEL